MYVSSVLSKAQSNTPKEYTNRARDEIARKLNLPHLNAPKPTSTTTLRHGPSPLQRVSSMASDSSLTRTLSNDSLETISENSVTSTSQDLQHHQHQQQQQQQQQQHTNKVKSIFGSLGKLRRKTSNSSVSSLSQESFPQNEQDPADEDAIMEDDYDDVPIINQMQPLQPVPSIGSVSTASSKRTTSTMQSISTRADSLFSNQSSLATGFTGISTYDELPAPATYGQQFAPAAKASAPMFTLQEALPKRFDDMYAPELLADPNLLIDGRPMFTKRPVIDWELNDIRSLLILEKLLPEWNGQLPIIYSPPGFKFEYLPLDADDLYIVKTLVESDIYKEANLDMAFRIQTAKYTLHAARSRHAQILRNSGLPLLYNNRLSKPEWRNVIENFLLNLAVEAQCRHDFRKACSELKRVKKKEASSSTPSPIAASAQASKFNGKNSLLRKAILNDVSQSSSSTAPANSSSSSSSVKLSKEDKARLWTDVQSKVYRRIGLDWAPDMITG